MQPEGVSGSLPKLCSFNENINNRAQAGALGSRKATKRNQTNKCCNLGTDLGVYQPRSMTALSPAPTPRNKGQGSPSERAEVESWFGPKAGSRGVSRTQPPRNPAEGRAQALSRVALPV